jgi:2,4-dienoyl-CoA reductase (NADPH2)
VEEGIENGITMGEAIQVARMAEDAGSDAIHVSRIPPLVGQPGALLPMAETIKKAVSIPVVAVMKIDPELGESALQAGQADFIAFGRALFADPDLPNKVSFGRLDEIEQCIYCDTCRDGLNSPDGIDCTVNPTLGKEREFLNQEQ